MALNILEIAAQKNQETIDAMRGEVSMGKAKDFADYRYQCGIIRGLGMANGKLQEYSQELERDEDEE